MPNLTNAQFTEENHLFKKCCVAVGIPPTKRQASKFRRKFGKAWFADRSKVNQLTINKTVIED